MVVSLKISRELSLGEAEARGVAAEFELVVFVVAVWPEGEGSTAHNLGFLGGERGTSIWLISALWIQAGVMSVGLAFGMALSRLRSISMKGFT